MNTFVRNSMSIKFIIMLFSIFFLVSKTVDAYVPPYGTYECVSSNFPGIYEGTIGIWDEDGWTVNGTTYRYGAPGDYSRTSNGFIWSSGFFTVRWRRVRD